jgi:hypothetical protein
MPGKVSANRFVAEHGKPRENSLLSSFRREQQKQEVKKTGVDTRKNIRKHET